MSNYKGIKNVSTIFFFFRATTQCFYTKYGIQKVPINNFAFIFALLPKDNIFWKQRLFLLWSWFTCVNNKAVDQQLHPYSELT